MAAGRLLGSDWVTSVGEGRVGIIRFTGTRGELLSTILRGFLLMVPTVGIYRFWLVTWKRRFYWQHTEIDGDPLEYTGRAMQLLVGFLIALGFFLPAYLVVFYLSTLSPSLILVGYGGFAVLVFFLSGYAVYRARRFRLSRTLWRGIRFGQSGNAWTYALRRFLWSILNIATLGLAYPFMAASLWRYRYGHTRFGDAQMRFDGTWKTIAGPYYRYWGLGLALAGLLFGLVQPELPASLLGLLGILLAAALFLGYYAYQAREISRFFSTVSLGGARLTTRVRARALVGQMLLYWVVLAGVAIAAAMVGGLLVGVLLLPAAGAPDPAAQFGALFAGGWVATVTAIASYLVFLAAWAIVSELILGFGYWRVVAVNSSIAGIDSLQAIRASGAESALAGEGLADALNVGAY